MPEFVTMKVALEKPPMYDMIVAAFPCAKNKGVMFSFGDVIYYPTGNAWQLPLQNCLMAHENVHRKQQAKHGSIASWWLAYIRDPEFCFAQELPAHIEEYNQFCLDTPQRNVRRIYLRHVAERLSGPLYGNVMTYNKAKKAIKDGAKA